MSNILQYAPWCKIYIITERPWEGLDKAHASQETVQKGLKYLQQKHEEEGETTVSKEEYEQIFDVGAERQVYDVSKDIISGQVSLNINQAHSMAFTLANADGKYTNLFMPNDRIILFLKRVRVVQTFSGLLDSVPVKTVRKNQPVSFLATCNFKRLVHTYWNPYLYFGKGWIQPEITPEEYLHYLLEEVGGWRKEDVYIQPFHDIEFWNQLAEYSIQAPAASITGDTTATGSSASPGGTELTTGNALDAEKIDNYLWGRNSPMAGSGKIFVEMGKKYGINPALVLAIAGHESEYGTSKVTGAVYLTKAFNYWGWGGQGGFKSFSSMSAAVEEVSSWLKNQYLTPGAQYYKDGTIAGISYAYVEPSGQYVDSWTKSVTACYNELMQKCVNPNSTVGLGLNFDNPSTPEEEQEALRKRKENMIDSGSGAGTKRRIIVEEAYAQIGKPYVQADKPGHRVPDNFDCSTFVKWCYAKAGLEMPAPTWSAVEHMKNMGTYVASNDIDRALRELQPGDVIEWFGSRGLNPPDHTGIYVGNGKMVHAGRPVKESDVRSYHENVMPIYGWGTHRDIGGAFTGDLPGGSELVQDGLNTMLYDLLGYQGAPGSIQTIEGVFQLAVQEKLLKHVLEAAKFGMYVCNTDGTGRFIARWADYFGEEPDAKGNSGPHFSIEDIEIKTGSVQVNDMNMVTHQFVIGDSAPSGSITEEDWYAANYFDESGQPQGDGLGIAVTAFNSERLGILNESEWTAEEFIKRFGYRPSVEEELLINNVAQAQYYSEYLFRTKWASCVTGNLQTTFLPEVRPMMVIKIPSWRMQFYVQSAVHTFGTKFGSSFSLIAGAFLDDSLGSRNPMLAKINSSPIGDNYNLAIGEADAISPGSGTAKIFGPESGKSPFSWFNPFGHHSPY